MPRLTQVAMVVMAAFVWVMAESVVATAGTISGTVKDAETGRPLPGNTEDSCASYVMLSKWNAKSRYWERLRIYHYQEDDWNGEPWYWYTEYYSPDALGQFQINNYWIKEYDDSTWKYNYIPAQLQTGRYLLEVSQCDYIAQRQEFSFNSSVDTSFGDVLMEKNPVDLSYPSAGIAVIQRRQLKLKYFVTNLTGKQLTVGTSSTISVPSTTRTLYSSIYGTFSTATQWLELAPYESRAVEESITLPKELLRGQQIKTITTICQQNNVFGVLKQKEGKLWFVGQ